MMASELSMTKDLKNSSLAVAPFSYVFVTLTLPEECT